jgi:hypothetical protein
VCVVIREKKQSQADYIERRLGIDPTKPLDDGAETSDEAQLDAAQHRRIVMSNSDMAEALHLALAQSSADQPGIGSLAFVMCFSCVCAVCHMLTSCSIL